MYNNNPYYGDSNNQPQSFMNESVLENYCTKAEYQSNFLSDVPYTELYSGDITLNAGRDSGSITVEGSDKCTDFIFVVHMTGSFPTNSSDPYVFTLAPWDETSIGGAYLFNNASFINTTGRCISRLKITYSTTNIIATAQGAFHCVEVWHHPEGTNSYNATKYEAEYSYNSWRPDNVMNWAVAGGDVPSTTTFNLTILGK